MRQKQTAYEAATTGGVSKVYSAQGLAALTDVILETILTDTNKTHVRATEVRDLIVVGFGASLRRASFEIIRDALASHPWLASGNGNSFKIRREFDEPADLSYI